MNYSVQFTPEARDQLAQLEDYIADKAAASVAACYVDAIVSYCVSLATFPLRGMRREDLAPGLRITNFRSRVVIAFVVDASVVTIVGIFYAGQDFETAFLEE
ncbi:type II toxin-antitoxin system RelE/ParE family toxin [Xanthomonas albilineans]|uniref:type II toxin-antitoxin system RelE/ParE family toxin n=1 Tax=Xanthomonas albilineans TaxID=29447 RepID=UPI0005F3185D|nr:type II toxin-antitoxin system RelE/ParE family toxin [Xanthomonas albilineans]